MSVEVEQLVNASVTVVDSTRPRPYDLVDLPLSDPNSVVTNGQKKPKSQAKSAEPVAPTTATAPEALTGIQAWRHPSVTLTIVWILTTVGLTWWAHYSASQGRATDEHIEHVMQPKFDALNSRLDGFTERIGRLEGKLNTKEKELSDRIEQQAALNRLEDPQRQTRALATIQAELVKAMREGRFDAIRQDLPTYRSALQIIPQSTTAYWSTLAAVVNAQTEANRQIGGFPDPNVVKKPCVSSKDPKLISNRTFESCEIVLDGYTLIDVTFENSVINYRGGDAKLARVHFSNCVFYLDVFTQPPRQLALLASLLKSSDQKNVEVK